MASRPAAPDLDATLLDAFIQLFAHALIQDIDDKDRFETEDGRPMTEETVVEAIVRANAVRWDGQRISIAPEAALTLMSFLSRMKFRDE